MSGLEGAGTERTYIGRTDATESQPETQMATTSITQSCRVEFPKLIEE